MAPRRLLLARPWLYLVILGWLGAADEAADGEAAPRWDGVQTCGTFSVNQEVIVGSGGLEVVGCVLRLSKSGRGGALAAAMRGAFGEGGSHNAESRCRVDEEECGLGNVEEEEWSVGLGTD